MTKLNVEFGKSYVTAGGEVVRIVRDRGIGLYQFTGTNGRSYNREGMNHFCRKDEDTLVREYGASVEDVFTDVFGTRTVYRERVIETPVRRQPTTAENIAAVTTLGILGIGAILSGRR